MSDQTEGRERVREGMRGEKGNQNYISMREHEERGREEQQECTGAGEEGESGIRHVWMPGKKEEEGTVILETRH